MKMSIVSAGPPLLRLRLEDQITLSEVQRAGEVLESLLGPAGYAQRVLFDLEQTTYIDSSGISWLLICHKRFFQNGGKVVYHSPPPLVDQTLSILRLNLVLHLAENEEQAQTLALEAKA